jgi:hypothetical protein
MMFEVIVYEMTPSDHSHIVYLAGNICNYDVSIKINIYLINRDYWDHTEPLRDTHVPLNTHTHTHAHTHPGFCKNVNLLCHNPVTEVHGCR